MVKNKLSDWKRKYTHFDDCRIEGCPGHECNFVYHHVTESFTFDFGDGKEITIDGTQIELLRDYIKDLTE